MSYVITPSVRSVNSTDKRNYITNFVLSQGPRDLAHKEQSYKATVDNTGI